MKVVVDISKLPCKNGKSCVDCHFYTADLCEVPTQLEKFPKFEERPHGEWIDEGAMAEGHPHRAFNCSVCDGHIIRVDSDLPNFCEFCGADMREGEAE